MCIFRACIWLVYATPTPSYIQAITMPPIGQLLVIDAVSSSIDMLVSHLPLPSHSPISPLSLPPRLPLSQHHDHFQAVRRHVVASTVVQSAYRGWCTRKAMVSGQLLYKRHIDFVQTRTGTNAQIQRYVCILKC